MTIVSYLSIGAVLAVVYVTVAARYLDLASEDSEGVAALLSLIGGLLWPISLPIVLLTWIAVLARPKGGE